MKASPKRRELPPPDSLHSLSTDGQFYFDEPGDGIPAPDPTIQRLPILSDLGTQHPEKRYRVLASDTYARNVATEIDAPTIRVVFSETRIALSGTGYTRFEVTDVTPRIRGLSKR